MSQENVLFMFPVTIHGSMMTLLFRYTYICFYVMFSICGRKLCDYRNPDRHTGEEANTNTTHPFTRRWKSESR